MVTESGPSIVIFAPSSLAQPVSRRTPTSKVQLLIFVSRVWPVSLSGNHHTRGHICGEETNRGPWRRRCLSVSRIVGSISEKNAI